MGSARLELAANWPELITLVAELVTELPTKGNTEMTKTLSEVVAKGKRERADQQSAIQPLQTSRRRIKRQNNMTKSRLREAPHSAKRARR